MTVNVRRLPSSFLCYHSLPTLYLPYSHHSHWHCLCAGMRGDNTYSLAVNCNLVVIPGCPIPAVSVFYACFTRPFVLTSTNSVFLHVPAVMSNTITRNYCHAGATYIKFITSIALKVTCMAFPRAVSSSPLSISAPESCWSTVPPVLLTTRIPPNAYRSVEFSYHNRVKSSRPKRHLIERNMLSAMSNISKRGPTSCIP